MKSVQNDFAKTAIFVSSQVDDAGLTPIEFRIYCHIARRAGGGYAFPSAESMARICRVNRKTVFAALKTLFRYGMIRKSTRVGASNLYHLTAPGEWMIPLDQGTQTGQPETVPGYPNGTTPGYSSGTTPGYPNGTTPVPFETPLRVSTEVTPLKELHLRESSFVGKTEKPTKPRMKKPTPAEWIEQAKAKYPWWPPKDVLRVHDHYEANGWKQSNGNPIVDWKAAQRTCYRNWESQHPRAEYDYKVSQVSQAPEPIQAPLFPGAIFGGLNVA